MGWWQGWRDEITYYIGSHQPINLSLYIQLYTHNKFEVIWSNQWEPNKKVQHASDVYINNFGDTNHSNEDIEQVLTTNIPNHDVLVGGFPCQDYSVASLLKNSKGLLLT